MKQIMLSAFGDLAILILRFTAGGIMLIHGLQKSFGLFGGYGFKATMNFFTENMKLPWIVSLLVIVLEVMGPIGLIAGALSRIWAVGLIVIMTGAIITTNAKNGLFMNWSGSQGGEGFEYHLLFIGICLAIVICGSGRYSVDHFISRS